MVPPYVLRPLWVALLSLLALAPSAGRPLPAVAAARATFTVTSTSDAPDARRGDGVCAAASGQCTLRAATQEADAQPVGSRLTITVPAGNYRLPLGQLVLSTNAIALRGAGAPQTILQGQGSRVLLTLSPLATIDGVTLAGGNAGSSAGGGVANLGRAVLSRSTVVSDTAENGGGLYNAPAALLYLASSAVISDTAPTGSGGGILNEGTLALDTSRLVGNTAGYGGAMASTGTLTMTASIVAANTATFSNNHGAGGGGININGTASIVSSTFSGNTAIHGGGIAIQNGTLTVTNSTFRSNSSLDGAGIENYGGTVRVTGSTLSGNTASVAGGGIENGGALDLGVGTLSVTNSMLSSNAAVNGGGIRNEGGAVSVASSTLSGNTASDEGGGIDNLLSGTVSVTNSTLSRNTAAQSEGGGISSMGILSVTNSMLSGNAATSGGGIAAAGTATVTGSTLDDNTASSIGGGIYSHALLSVSNTTLSDNTAPTTGGMYNWLIGAAALTYDTIAGNSSGLTNDTSSPAGIPATLALTGTIVADSTAGPNCTGPITESAGFNLDSGTSCGFSQSTDITNTNPLLGPLADNGGATPTMALLPGSPAINNGGISATGCPATDQRGVPRPQGPTCDIGAYETMP